MNAKVFLFRSFIISSCLVVLIIGINFRIDLYGLFRETKGKEILIYSDERTSKFLLAHAYVPENFDSYIIGPSLSANLDPSKYPHYRIYNLSMMGANITEQKVVLEKVLEVNTPKSVIICLHPYLTMDSGMKTGMINDKEYWGAFGSFGLFKAYGLRLIRSMELLPNKFPKEQFNAFGNNDYSKLLAVPSVKDKIEEELKLPHSVNAHIDSIALQQFDELINMLHTKKVKVVAYFHPLPLQIFNKYKAELLEYQKIMKDHLGDNSVLINFTTSEYDFFTDDLSNYIDHGHLSEKGQQYILGKIIEKSNLE